MNAYTILQVTPKSTDAQIRTAYRHLAAILHPDKNPAPDACQRFQELHDAFDLIETADKREEYNTVHMTTKFAAYEFEHFDCDPALLSDPSMKMRQRYSTFFQDSATLSAPKFSSEMAAFLRSSQEELNTTTSSGYNRGTTQAKESKRTPSFHQQACSSQAAKKARFADEMAECNAENSLCLSNS